MDLFAAALGMVQVGATPPEWFKEHTRRFGDYCKLLVRRVEVLEVMGVFLEETVDARFRDIDENTTEWTQGMLGVQDLGYEA
jgi:hypothetical protein